MREWGLTILVTVIAGIVFGVLSIWLYPTDYELRHDIATETCARYRAANVAAVKSSSIAANVTGEKAMSDCMGKWGFASP
ncbi:MAG TPA: hypothetical protein VEJ16_01915 [Alphaproteobacteria bacterium]|nr:hypothetical protein [Alphaproteobacteria bacterium]